MANCCTIVDKIVSAPLRHDDKWQYYDKIAKAKGFSDANFYCYLSLHIYNVKTVVDGTNGREHVEGFWSDAYISAFVSRVSSADSTKQGVVGICCSNHNI